MKEKVIKAIDYAENPRSKLTLAERNDMFFTAVDIERRRTSTTVQEKVAKVFKRMGFVVTPFGIGWQINLKGE